jgi:hypothetical protein
LKAKNYPPLHSVQTPFSSHFKQPGDVSKQVVHRRE